MAALTGVMGVTLVVVVLAAVFTWSTLAGGLRRSPVTAAVVVVVLGVVLVLVQVISRLRWVTS